jgi:O-antigen/teichoic acid export membrane protein
MATLETPKSILVRSKISWLTDSSWKQVKEYSPTFLTEFLIMASQILFYKLAAHYLGQTGFSEYALARRTVSLLQPAVMLGLGVGLPRYIAMAHVRANHDHVAHYFGATIRYVAVSTLLVVAALLLAKDAFAYLLYGSVRYRYLIPPLALMLIGLSLHGVIYAYLRGHLLMTRANILNLVNLGMAPALVFIWFSTSASSLLWGLGAAWTVVALTALVWTPLHAVARSSRTEHRELLSYGLQRVPGDFILLALLALPAIFTAHTAGIQNAGYVAFGASLTNMIAAVFAPVGVILLPKASRSAGNGLLDELRTEIRLIVLGTVVVSTMMVAVLEMYAPSLIRLFLGSGFESSAAIVRIVAIAAMPLALYYVLRSVIDASHHRAVNAINLSASLVIFLAGSSLTFWIRGNTPLVLWSFVCGTTLLAILTLREVLVILRPKVQRIL